MADYLRQIRRALSVPVPYVAWLTTSVFLAVSGPFGTYSGFPTISRLFFWSLVVGGAILLGLVIRVSLQVRFPKMQYWPAALIAVFVLSVLFAWPAREFAGFMSQGNQALLPNVFETFVIIGIIGIAVAALRAVTVGRGPLTKPADASAEGRIPPRLLDRIEPAKRGNLVRISARDHYLDVHTVNGLSEVLLRFSDALAELDGVDGLRVHRSHWVAVDAVTGTEKVNGRTFLLLRDGARVPVSRGYHKRVEERELI